MQFDLLAQSFTPGPDWRFENFNGQNHFISREISDLVIDKHGYVWASCNGLQRFDGYRTTNFKMHDREEGGLKGNYAGVAIDKEGRVWISSAGLCYYDDASGKFIYVQPDSKRKVTFATSFFFQKDCVWFVTNYGLTKLDLRSLKLSFTSLTRVTDPLCIYLTDENTLIISSREKVYAYDISKNSYSAHTLTYNGSLVKTFALTKKGNTVFLATNYGLFTLKNSNDIALVSEGAKDIFINDLVFLPGDKEKKYLFLATEGKGLMLYNTLLKKVEFTYLHDDDNPYSLPNNIISKMFADKKGRLWLSTDLGISMLDLANQQLKMRVLNENNSGVLGISKIARDKYDSSKVWMSSYNRGMICVNWKTKEIESIYNKDPESQNIYDFAQLSKNKWLIASQKKIMKWAPRSGVLDTKVLPVPDSIRILCNIKGLIMAGDNTCFITTNRGLFKYDLLTDQISVASENDKKKPEDALKYILLNGFFDGEIVWAASRNGLFSYDTVKKVTTIYTGNGDRSDYFFFDIAKSGNDEIICASGSGVLIFNRQTKTFKMINVIANITNPACGHVISVNNTVWAGSDNGILNYDLSTQRSVSAADETSMMQVYSSSAFTLINNEIVFGFRNGYAYFTPGLKNISIPSDPVIERVYVNNKPVLRPLAPANTPGKLIFSHAENSINIAFTAFSYTNPDHINFRYRLSGANPGWQYAEDQRSANYAQLEPGDYTFYVQSGNKNGTWNSRLASFSFIINPPFWETWWARALFVLITALILYLLYRYRIKNILAIQKIRERIASDFHDDIGSALSSISIFSEVADTQLEAKLPHEQTREIVAHIALYSRNMLDAMDDIIWAVNPKNDHFNDLAIRIREFAIPMLEARNINFDINIPDNILNTRIKMEARKNIFLIFKECINNILKHSCCTALKVSVNKLNNQLEFIISDNGKGFDTDAPSTRNGLKNMHKRAGEINGIINILSTPGAGTVTRLLINII